VFNSTILDVVIGLSFCFFVVSIITSATVEGIASLLKWRAATLLDGVKSLLNDSGTGLAKDVFNSALVNPRAPGNAASTDALTARPSYIDPKQFGNALIDVLKLAPGTVAELQKNIDTKISDLQIRAMLHGMILRTSGDLGRLRDELASWFDASMDRVSGVYKRKVQAWTFLVALTLSVLLNVDTFSIATKLWEQPIVANKITGAQYPSPRSALDALEEIGMPMGWDEATVHRFAGFGGAIMTFGWLISAVSALFGAPFWFDTLQQFVRLRGAGPRADGAER